MSSCLFWGIINLFQERFVGLSSWKSSTFLNKFYRYSCALNQSPAGCMKYKEILPYTLLNRIRSVELRRKAVTACSSDPNNNRVSYYDRLPPRTVVSSPFGDFDRICIVVNITEKAEDRVCFFYFSGHGFNLSGKTGRILLQEAW